MSSEPYIPRFLSVSDVAALLGVSSPKVMEWIKTGQLRATAKQRIRISDLRAFKSKQAATEVPENKVSHPVGIQVARLSSSRSRTV